MREQMSRRVFATSTFTGSLAAALPLSAGRAQEATPSASPVSRATGLTPERVAAAVEQLPSVTQTHMDQTGIPGIAVSVVYQDDVIFSDGFGVREVGSNSPVAAETVFQVASVSKALSSTVVAALVAEGVVDWDTRIADIYPEFQLSDPWVTAHVTIADLFSHRSGLPDHAGDLLEDLGATRDEVLHRLRFLELEGAFRDSYAYTNFGLTAAAVAAATAAGSTWENLADERLFTPLGMASSSFRHSDFTAQENRALLHVRRDGEWVQMFDRQPDPQAPAGGASSTVVDMAQWMRLQLGIGSLDGIQMIDSAALGKTHLAHSMPGVPEAPYSAIPSFYGLGWNVNYDTEGNVTLGHSGAFAYGASTAVYLRPAEGLGIVVLTNGDPMGVPESICLSFLDLCYTGAMPVDYLPIIQPIIEASVLPDYGDAVANPPAEVDPASDPDVYVGLYENDFFADLQVVEDSEGLSMMLGPNGESFVLTHYSRDVFTYQPVGENAGRRSAVTFTVDADGLASKVVLENLNVYNAGTFIRA